MATSCRGGEGVEWWEEESGERLERFTTLLLNWNQTHKITAYDSRELIWENILDSLRPLELFPDLMECQRVVDIGSGAGFPGVVLAAVLHDTEWTLCEPIAKKASFLMQCARELSLGRLSVWHGRVEELVLSGCDLITSRAVLPAPDLVSLAGGLLERGGSLLLYKGSESAAIGAEGYEHQVVQHGKRAYVRLIKQ